MENKIKAILEEYYIIVENTRNWITPEEFFANGYENAQIVGIPTRIEDGTAISDPVVTSFVKKIEDDLVYTFSGSVYKLGEKNKDYKSFIEAKENNITIAYRWNVKVEDDDNVFLSAIFDTDEEKSGGFINDKIVSYDEEKNLVTLESGDTYYIHWIERSLDIVTFLIFGFGNFGRKGLTLSMLTKYGFEDACKLKKLI